MPCLVSVSEAAEIIGLSTTAVYAMCEAGQLPYRRVGVKGGRIRIEQAAVEEYLNRTIVTPAQPSPSRRRQSPRLASGGLSRLRAAGYKG